MKKKLRYPLLLLLFLGAMAFVVLRYNGKLKNKTVAFYALKERRGALAELPEWASVKEKGAKLIRTVRETPGDAKSTLALATLYIQEGRATGDFGYYNAAAMHYIDAVLETKPDEFEALVLKSVVQLSDHHFAEGLQTAEKAKAINPYNAYVWGLITDGAVETGRYEAAVQSLDKMVSIRPDLRSYSRIAYLREINGDTNGAIAAMKEAVEAGYPGEESTEWARVQLAHLYEKTGDVKAAEMHYRVGLNERPGYAYALAGLGNLAADKSDWKEAIAFYKQAIAVTNDYGFRESLAKVYLLSGKKEEADKIINAVIDELTQATSAGEGATNHHADLELAWAYDLKGDAENALNHAQNEYSRRPDNIDVNEAVAWAQYKAGEAKEATTYLQKALRTGSKNPALLCRAAFVYNAAGEKAKAKEVLQQALSLSPVMDPLLKADAQKLLKQL